MHWRQIQKTNITRFNDLLLFLQIDPLQQKQLLYSPRFPLNLPLRIAKKIRKNDLNDPLFKQFVASNLENDSVDSFSLEPTQDTEFQLTPRLLKKYTGRALLMPTSACAMHCRYCFRQNYGYTATPSLDKELSLIAKDPSIFEVILSGGDPLSLSDDQLTVLIESLNTIVHVKIIRFHTRFPIGIPERITSELIQTLSKSHKTIVFVFHINHPREIDHDVKHAISQLKPFQLLNQSVLLKGINDQASTLISLSLKLNECGILPYYLHQLDRIQGSMHFEVKTEIGLKLIKQMQKNLPGYLVPRFVQEIPHQQHKTLLTS